MAAFAETIRTQDVRPGSGTAASPTPISTGSTGAKNAVPVPQEPSLAGARRTRVLWLAVALFGILVWPTIYRHEHLAGGRLLRINRLTGTVEHLGAYDASWSGGGEGVFARMLDALPISPTLALALAAVVAFGLMELRARRKSSAPRASS